MLVQGENLFTFICSGDLPEPVCPVQVNYDGAWHMLFMCLFGSSPIKTHLTARYRQECLGISMLGRKDWQYRI